MKCVDDVGMWDVFKVRRMIMMFAGYDVCGDGTKRDFFYLYNVHVNNLAIYFHIYDWLKQGGERPAGREGCCFPATKGG